ncbi:hypothetical protein [Actinotalea ferrariae]|uniref:hypothetical protein n=1 Tax=Actinotalea ferrariae TaxID=1386098 RepID=UPI001FE11CF0|nr:hypothetical protein [Actinotalea ferrariae]
MRGVRWDALFADMELQVEAMDADARAAEVAELTRAERSAVHLTDRLRAGLAGPVEVVVRTGARVTGEMVDVAASWLLLQDGAREHLVPTAALVTVRGAPLGVAPGQGSPLRRLGLGHALRALARDRCVVRLETLGGPVVGRLDAVGADHVDVGLVDVADHRPSGVRDTVLLSAVGVVSRL